MQMAIARWPAHPRSPLSIASGVLRWMAQSRLWQRPYALPISQPTPTNAPMGEDTNTTVGKLSGASDLHGDATRQPNNGNTILSAECEAFIRQHERDILNYLWRMLGDEQSAYDLTQEVFLRAWQHFDTIRAYDHPRSWLFRVATNLALTQLQRRRAPVGAPETLDETNAPSSSDPTWRLAERDLVRETLRQLAPKRRAALVLREVYGLSADEIGKALGMRATAVRMTIFRAREQFRAIYLREGGQEP